MTRPNPTREDFRDSAEVLIDLLSRTDDQGRARFAAFWLDDDKPGGVAGQVFHTDLNKFIDVEKREGYAPRIWRGRS